MAAPTSNQTYYGQNYEIVSLQEDEKRFVTSVVVGAVEDAEFVVFGGSYVTHLGDDVKDIQLRAVYWLASMMGGVWLILDNKMKRFDYEEESGAHIDSLVLLYPESGDQKILESVQNVQSVWSPQILLASLKKGLMLAYSEMVGHVPQLMWREHLLVRCPTLSLVCVIGGCWVDRLYVCRQQWSTSVCILR